MRAKMVIDKIDKNQDGSESITFRAVGKSDGYDEQGKDENSTFSAFTPSADLNMNITNPDLQGTFFTGQTFYVDFTETTY